MVRPQARRCEPCDVIFQSNMFKERYKNRSKADKARLLKYNYNKAKKRLLDPVHRAKYNARNRAWYARKIKEDPNFQKRTYARVRADHLRRMEDPEYAAQHRLDNRESRRRADIKKNKQALLAIKLKLGNTDNGKTL